MAAQQQYQQQGNSLGKNIALIALSIAAIGLVLGLMPTVFGMVGEQAYEEGTESQLEESNDQEKSEDAKEREDKEYKNGIIRSIASIAPYFGLIVGGFGGLIAALRLGGNTRDVVIAAGAGAFAGAFLFVFLSTAVAVFQYAPIESGGFGSSDEETIMNLKFGALIVNSLGIGVLSAISGALSGYLTDQLNL